jgi:uncharacterized iron-regulated membrane protein
MTRSRPHARNFWLTAHRYVGLACLIFLVIEGVTGSVLVFRQQLDALLNPTLYRTASTGAAGAALSPGELVRAVESEDPAARVTSVPLTLRPGTAAVLEVVARHADGQVDDKAGEPLAYDELFADPISGHIIGRRLNVAGWALPHLMQGVYQLHVDLMGGTAGRWILGIAAGLWALGTCVGLYLTLPRAGPFWKKWQPAWKVRAAWRMPGSLLELHRASGLWLLLATLVLSLTGFAMSSFSELTAPLATRLSPSHVAALNDDSLASAPRLRGRELGFDAATQRARAFAAKRDAALKPATASYDADANLYRIGFTRSGRLEWSRLGPIYYSIDASSGALAYVDDPYRDSAGRVVIRSLYPLHSGQVLGWATRLLVFLTGVVVAEMAVTGGWMWCYHHLRSRVTVTVRRVP